MSNQLPRVAVADDLTGAAEVAAVAHRNGWNAVILRGLEEPVSQDADLTVFTTDSRLDEPAVAADKVKQLASSLRQACVFKKVDSVLRGPVAAEVEALMGALGKERALLVPANPSLGRTVRSGHYFVHRVPLHETAFAKDPHHPAQSSLLADLLGSAQTPVSFLRTDEPLPERGIIVGEVASAEDIEAWADRCDDSLVAAGAAEFFSAWLKRQRATPKSATLHMPATDGATLILMGSTAPAGRKFRTNARSAGFSILPLPREMVKNNALEEDALRQWQQVVEQALATNRRAIIFADESWPHDAPVPELIRTAFGRLAEQLWKSRRFNHFIVEGGATAETVLTIFGWSQFAFVYEWALGVVSLKPRDANDVIVTLKPGSYEWPAELRKRLLTP